MKACQSLSVAFSNALEVTEGSDETMKRMEAFGGVSAGDHLFVVSASPSRPLRMAGLGPTIHASFQASGFIII